jgi:hypothetical protein
MSEIPQPKPWSDWYYFARNELDFRHEESVEYANLRFVEEQNRARLRVGGLVGRESTIRRHRGEIRLG